MSGKQTVVLDSETCRILDERASTFDQDKETAEAAREVIADIRRKLNGETQ